MVESLQIRRNLNSQRATLARDPANAHPTAENYRRDQHLLHMGTSNRYGAEVQADKTRPVPPSVPADLSTSISDSRYVCLQAAIDCQTGFSPIWHYLRSGWADHGGQTMKGTSISILLLAFGATGASTPVLADDLLGFYVGAAVGEAHVRTAKDINGDTDYDYHFDEQHGAWKMVVGFRPISPLGIELEYIEFGNPSSGPSNTGLGGLSKADQKAATLFGLGYLPLPVPFLDVYGKLGIARLHTTTTEVSPIPLCPAGLTSCSPTTFSMSDSSTNFAYGAGVQGKIGSLAIRAEYERINASGGNPDIFSLGVVWIF
jgi:outer membrane immunogenic protein